MHVRAGRETVGKSDHEGHAGIPLDVEGRHEDGHADEVVCDLKTGHLLGLAHKSRRQRHRQERRTQLGTVGDQDRLVQREHTGLEKGDGEDDDGERRLHEKAQNRTDDETEHE